MCTLYELILELCSNKGIKPGRMCSDLGFSRSTMSDLKMGRKKSLSSDYLSKIAEYFDVSVDYLLTGGQKEKAPTSEGERVIEDKDLRAAFFDGIDESLSDEQKEEYWEDARDYISFKIRQKQKKDGQSN